MSQVKPARTALKAPANAWPTTLLAALAIGSLATSMALHSTGSISSPLAITLSTIATFAVFTPMHDASHKSVSRSRWVNGLVGHLSAFTLLAPFAAFRYVHLEHHKHTNDPERDPDFYAGAGPTWLLPLRWLTQDLHYYLRILRIWNTRPRSERAGIIAHFACTGAVIASLIASGYGTSVLIAWLIPARIAIGLLSFAFDYLPHVPHQVPAKENRFAATRIIEAPLLTPVLLYQNYHLIHHLYPGVPFYRYRAIFEEREAELIAKGAQVVRVGSR